MQKISMKEFMSKQNKVDYLVLLPAHLSNYKYSIGDDYIFLLVTNKYYYQFH
jgi:hypothetical protein